MPLGVAYVFTALAVKYGSEVIGEKIAIAHRISGDDGGLVHALGVTLSVTVPGAVGDWHG